MEEGHALDNDEWRSDGVPVPDVDEGVDGTIAHTQAQFGKLSGNEFILKVVIYISFSSSNSSHNPFKSYALYNKETKLYLKI